MIKILKIKIKVKLKLKLQNKDYKKTQFKQYNYRLKIIIVT